MRKDISTKVLDLNSTTAREKKRYSLGILLATCPGGETALRASSSYLDACKNVSPEVFAAACWSIRDTWTNEFTPPQPGHIKGEARRLRLKALEERNTTEWRFDPRQVRLTPEVARRELERVRALPWPVDVATQRFEVVRRISLERYVDREPREVPTQPRGTDLTHIGDFTGAL